jgi:hypothetical protein
MSAWRLKQGRPSLGVLDNARIYKFADNVFLVEPETHVRTEVKPEPTFPLARWLSSSAIGRLRTFMRAHLEEENQAPLSIHSVLGYLLFRAKSPELSEGGLVLTPAGNVRAVWWNSGGERVGLEFLPDRRVKYVALVRRAGDMSVLSGIDLSARVLPSLDSFGATRLLRAAK